MATFVCASWVPAAVARYNRCVKTRVLVVEDDEGVRELVAFHLSKAGFDVLEAPTAEAAWQHVDDVSVVVLDRMLPGESGLAFLKRLRRSDRHRATAVLMLTALASEVDRVEGLDAGADDYLVKPFSAAELAARVRALTRRSEPARRISLGDWVLDRERVEVYEGDQPLGLTRREFDLLEHFAMHPGRVFSRRELLDRVWGEEFVGTERTVDQHVAQLRSRLDENLIETVRGRGYRLAPHPESR